MKNNLANILEKKLDDMSPIEIAIWFTYTGTTAYDMEQAANDLDSYEFAYDALMKLIADIQNKAK